MPTPSPRRRFDLRIGIVLVAAALGGFASGGCDDDPQSSGEIWCDGLCNAAQRCGSQDALCRSNCVSRRPGLANISTNGASAERPCIGNLSCPALAGNQVAWDAETSACWDQAQLSVVVTAHVQQFCEGHALAWFDCGFRLSLEECGQIYGMWNDAVLDRVAACDAIASCDAFRACQDGVFAAL